MVNISINTALTRPTVSFGSQNGKKQILIDRILETQTSNQSRKRSREDDSIPEENAIKRSKASTKTSTSSSSANNSQTILAQLHAANIIKQLNLSLIKAKDTLRSDNSSNVDPHDPLRNVEVEARLGTWRRFSDAEKQDMRSKKSHLFDAGTTKSFWYQAQRAMQTYSGWKDSQGKSCSAPTERKTYDIFYDPGGPNTKRDKIRVEIDGLTGKCTGNVVMKRKLCDPIDQTITDHYDLRVSVVNEHPHSAPSKYIQLAEKLFERPPSDLNSSGRLQRIWTLMRRGCPVRPKVGKSIKMDPSCHQGVNETDQLLRNIRKGGNRLNPDLARKMNWTLLNVDQFRSIDGHELSKKGGSSSSSSSSGYNNGMPPMEEICITCMPGKLFKGNNDTDALKPEMWHHYPICAYTGKIYMQDLEVIHSDMLIKGTPEKNASESDRPTEFRKKIRWSYVIQPGMKFELTCTQHSKRSVQDTETALKHYEMEFEIDFTKLSRTDRTAMDFTPLLETFIQSIGKLMYTE